MERASHSALRVCCLKMFCFILCKEVQEGKDQEKAQSERDSHYKNRGGKRQNCIFFPPRVYVGTLNLIASISGPSILTSHLK